MYTHMCVILSLWGPWLTPCIARTWTLILTYNLKIGLNPQTTQLKCWAYIFKTVYPQSQYPSFPKNPQCWQMSSQYLKLHVYKICSLLTNVLIISKTSTGPHNDTQTGAHHQLSELGCFTCRSHHRWWCMRRTAGWMTPAWRMTQARVNQRGLAKACCRS